MTAVLLGAVFLSLQLTTLVAVVSKNIEDADASSYTVHLICHNLREEQVQVLQDTQKKYAKKYDGAYEIRYVQPFAEPMIPCTTWGYF